jgi:hypothetical protein
MKHVVAVLSIFLGLASGSARATVTPGLTDTFQDGSTDGWATGSASPVAPVNVGSGGPGGAGDRYLSISATGGAGPGSRLVAFSGPQWGGDYVAAGVTGIRMQVNNLGNTDLSLRLYFEGTSFNTAFSADAVLVHAHSGWIPILFSTQSGALAGGAGVLSDVAQFRLYHSVFAGAPSGGAPIAATLGIDNVSAIAATVPEPSAWLAMLAGLWVLAWRTPWRSREARI